MALKKYKISFCTVCMNRLHNLKETLQRNINDNEDYDNLEFVVLNYNSKDGMEEWIKENMSEFILSGKMIYYRVNEPQKWNPSHSKNLAFKLASGDIICNIWADYYAGAAFAKFTNQQFNKDENIVLTPIDFHKTKPGFYPPPDTLGRVCVKKSDFLKVGGFDERMNKHGFEDYDFINRLELIGIKRVLIDNFSFLGYVSHPDSERYSLPEQNTFELLLGYISPWMSECVILYNNKTFERGVLVDNSTINATDYHYAYKPRTNRFMYTVYDDKWEIGTWEKTESQKIFLYTKAGKKVICIKTLHCMIDLSFDQKDARVFYHITDDDIIKGLMIFKHFYHTRSLMEDNLEKKKIRANGQNFGKAMVHKNFASQPIYI